MRWRLRLRRNVSCAEVLVTLQSYLDGETETTTARQLVGHLDDCPHCDHERQLYARIKLSLATRRQPVDPRISSALQAYGERLADGDPAL